MSTTGLLQLPLLAPAQAQKHVTHNEALLQLDALIHLSVISRSLTSPPATPAEGDRYIIPAGATGAWSGRTGQVAAFISLAWTYLTPRKGWRGWIEDESHFVIHDGAAWAAFTLHETDRLGINGTADSTNRLVVAGLASLFNHAGNGHQIKLNKAAAGDTASLLYQTAYSGRAEIGLTGDDALHVKVSADGSVWREALVVDAATGNTGMGTSPTTALHVAGPVRIGQYAKAALPAAAASGAGAMIYVSDDIGGAVIAFSDGSAWRRVTDRAVVS